jgi:hypothetical protein
MALGRNLVLACVAAVLVLTARPEITAANTVSYVFCPADTPHCYAIISQGVDVDLSSYLLSNLSSGSATITADCQRSSNTIDTFADNEMWLITSPNPSGPVYHSANWQPEWLEYGLNTGVVAGGYHGLAFFWARAYWAPTLGRYAYNEYLAPGTPSLSVGYAVKIVWNAGGYWQITRDGVSQESGLLSQQAPGVHQAVEAGAEMTTPYDFDDGEVTSLANVQGGHTYNSWTGYVFEDSHVYIVSQSSTYLYFTTWRTC